MHRATANPLSQLHLPMLTPANIKPKLSTSATCATYIGNSNTHHHAFHTNLILGLCKRYAQDATLNLTMCGGIVSEHRQPTTDKLPQLHPARHGTRQHQHQGYQREFVTTPTSYYELCKALALPEAKWCRSPLLLDYPNTAQSQSRDTQPRTRSRTIPELAGSTPVYATSGGTSP